MTDLLSLLPKCSLFKDKSPTEIDYLLSRIVYKVDSFKKEDVIFSPNQPADTMGIILSGAVDVQKIFPSGKIVIVTRKTAPDLFAEPSLFSKSKHYPETICACKPCKILFIHKNELLKLFTIDQTIILNFLKSVSESMLVLKHKIGILSLNSIQEKIAGFLIHEYRHEGPNENSRLITLPFSKKAWAEYMNVSRTSLSRELKNMEIAGVISVIKGKIKIVNFAKLEKILFQ
jgi:CRP-like cAMP-binding protein